jgi:Heterokaryon incompatibility protein (HET)
MFGTLTSSRDALWRDFDIEGMMYKYAALSYVWGGKQTFTLNTISERKLFQPGSIRANDPAIPATIRDAMVVCASLSIRHLWVDSLCISQDSSDRHDQIQLMHEIYLKAEVTIIVATGQDANAGLLGVRSGSRSTGQITAPVRNLALAIRLNPLSKVLPRNKWDSRAWTYQECLLSPRKLFFTSQQVCYSCMHDYLAEEFQEPIHEHPTSMQEYHSPKFFNSRYNLRLDNRLNWDV